MLDDVLSLIVLAIVSALALTGAVSAWSIGWTTAKAALFLGGSLSVGIWITPWIARRLARAGIHHVKLLAGWICAFFFAWLATVAGLAAIVGAFAAVAIVGKLLSGLGCPARMNRLAVGFVMMPRGEVGLIFAGIGKGIGVVDDGLFSAVILLVMVTTLLTPLALRWTLLPKT